jgi:deoxyribose-phosphate aldolase
MSRREQDPTTVNPVLARRLVAHLDLTDLRHEMDDAAIAALAARAHTPFGAPAGVCVRLAAAARLRPLLPPTTRLVVVANFPGGSGTAASVRDELRAARDAGADEIDLVYPYTAAQAGDRLIGPRLVETAAAETPFLKVIVEAAAYTDDPIGLLEAARVSLHAGAAMVKTSTGEVAFRRVAPSEVALLAEAVADHGAEVGLKVAGGVDLAFALDTLVIAERRLGPELTPARFRIGASRLLDELIGTERSEGDY